MSSRLSIRLSAEPALLGAGTLATTAFAILTAYTLRPRTIWKDIRLRRMIPGYGKKAKKVAFHFGHLGKETAVLPAASAIAIKLLTEGRRAGAVAVLSATTAGVAASHIFDVALPQKTPPPGRRAPFDPHYPSGHALHSASFLAIAAWVLSREGIANRRALAAGAGALALSLGVDRLIQDRHWTSDVVGGWLAAIGIAAFTAAAYEHVQGSGISPED